MLSKNIYISSSSIFLFQIELDRPPNTSFFTRETNERKNLKNDKWSNSGIKNDKFLLNFYLTGFWTLLYYPTLRWTFPDEQFLTLNSFSPTFLKLYQKFQIFFLAMKFFLLYRFFLDNDVSISVAKVWSHGILEPYIL